MRSGYRITLSMLTIMILLTITVGTSYSFYSVSDVQTNPNELVTTCFDISFNDNNGSSTIKLNSSGLYAYPMSEANALAKLTPYEFTVTNNCTNLNASQSVNYVVTLNTLTSTPSTLTNYLNYKLNTKSPTTITGTTTLLTSSTYSLMDSIKSGQGIDKSYVLTSGTLAPGNSKTFNLYLWIKEDACSGNACETEVMGKTFTGKVLVYAYM